MYSGCLWIGLYQNDTTDEPAGGWDAWRSGCAEVVEVLARAGKAGVAARFKKSVRAAAEGMLLVRLKRVKDVNKRNWQHRQLLRRLRDSVYWKRRQNDDLQT